MNYLWHAAEVFSKSNAPAVFDFCVIEKAVFEVELFADWKIGDVTLPQKLDGITVNAYIVRLYLLVVPYDYNLSADVLEKEGFWAGLTGLVHYHDIKYVRAWPYALSHSINGHDPSRYGRAALLHVLPRSPAMHGGILTTRSTK